jgi:hypothetical protein
MNRTEFEISPFAFREARRTTSSATNIPHAWAVEDEFTLAGFPQTVRDALRAKNESAAILRAAAAGYRDEATLTNLVFYSRHPERGGAPLRRDEPEFGRLAAEWADIANRLVRKAAYSPSTGPAQPAAPGASVDVVDVRGIYVSRSIAPQIEALLAAARADGVTLTGSGYRSPTEQIATRKKNCGQTHYDIYDKPSSACSPPTAKPGTSMHERGLAIDFKYGMQMAEQFKNTPGFRWLQRNASRFGLKNFAKEPWHWSTTGT